MANGLFLFCSLPINWQVCRVAVLVAVQLTLNLFAKEKLWITKRLFVSS